MLFYFTATGNSLYVAKQLDDDRLSIAQAIHEAFTSIYRITDACMACIHACPASMPVR